MLTRFCKLCFNVADESIVKLRIRRYAVKHYQVAEECSDENEIIREELFNEDDNDSEVKPKKPCIIKCKRKEFDFYEGDVYSKFRPIPLASRQWQHRASKGDFFTIYPKESSVEDEIDTSITFRGIDLDERLLKNLEEQEMHHPTEIQKLGIPILLEGQNAILTAETGCGKTLAFLIPLLQQILKWKPMADRGVNRPLGLILTPSRELTMQISVVARKLAKDTGIKIITLTGGKTKHVINNPPVGDFDLVISTLGIIRKLVSTDILKMDQVRHVVLDEADTLFDETFSDSLCSFLKKLPIGTDRGSITDFPPTAQITLNSATIPQNLPDSLYQIVEAESFRPITSGFEHQIRIPQKFLRLGSSEKPMTLLKLVKPKVKSKVPIIIFSNTTATCDFTSIFLKSFNIKCINLHGNQSVMYRRKKFMEFQNGLSHVLATTDSGARGLDTLTTKIVINYDFPLMTSEYIHRCGRIGRIGSPKDCKVINFISKPLEIILARKIEFATRRNSPIPLVDMMRDGKGEEHNFMPQTPKNDDNNQNEESREQKVLTEMNEAGFHIPQ